MDNIFFLNDKQMQVIYSAQCLPDLQSHTTFTHFTEHIQSIPITGFKHYLEFPGIKALIAAHKEQNNLNWTELDWTTLAWAIHTLIEHAIFTLSPGLDSNVGETTN